MKPSSTFLLVLPRSKSFPLSLSNDLLSAQTGAFLDIDAPFHVRQVSTTTIPLSSKLNAPNGHFPRIYHIDCKAFYQIFISSMSSHLNHFLISIRQIIVLSFSLHLRQNKPAFLLLAVQTFSLLRLVIRQVHICLSSDLPYLQMS